MLHQIGIGTLGPVFRTYEPTRDRLVAVKAFRLDIVPEQAQALAAALSRAAKASLFHPSIVEPIDAGVEGTLAYRAEEYVAAESLDVAMRHYAPAPIEKVLPYITQLAGAIDFARAAGVGHGGLHPRDVFVTPEEARATGFGVVEALEQVGIRAPIRRPYSAPERIDGSAWGTPADVFSLAAITFELLTGKRPAGTGSEIGALPDGQFAAALHLVLARAMHDDVSKRHTSALAFAGALEAASQGRPVTDVLLVPAPLPPATPPRVEEAPARENPLVSLEERAAKVEERVSKRIARAKRESREAPREEAAAPPPVVLPVLPAVQPQPEPAVEPEPEAPFPATLFDTQRNEAPPASDRFVDDFVDEQEHESELRSPLEDEPAFETSAPIPLEAPMFGSTPEPESHDGVDHSRPAILPYALVAVPMLLVGFAGGYFVGSRDRSVAPADAAQAAPAAASQYSDQKVSTPPRSSQAAPPATAPPAETPPAPAVTAPAPPAATVAKAPAPRVAEPRPPAAEKGQITVRSLPTHAGVTINGRWRGRTPLTLNDVPFGAYTIRVVQGGYQVARDEFTLNAHTPTRSFNPRLEPAGPAPHAPAAAAPAPAAAPPAPAATAGSLYIDSRPRGAAVTVDGKNVGQTPLSLPDMSIGTHTVRIEMDGKKPVTATPRVAAGKTERVTVSLEDKQ